MNHQQQQQQPNKVAEKKQKTRRTRQPKDPQISVARRNERERNRVKMVNNAFANLREHLPDELVERLVCDSKGKGKKFSKVETLRTAIQHIRNLVEVLNGSGDSPIEPTMYIHQQQHQEQELASPIPQSPALVYSQQQPQFTPESPVYTQQLTPSSPSVYSQSPPVVAYSHQQQQQQPHLNPTSPTTVYIQQQQQQTIMTPSSPIKVENGNSNWTYSQQRHHLEGASPHHLIKQEPQQVMQQQHHHELGHLNQLNLHLNLGSLSQQQQQAGSPPTWFPSPASSSSVSLGSAAPGAGNSAHDHYQQESADAFVPLHHAYQHHQISLYSQ